MNDREYAAFVDRKVKSFAPKVTVIGEHAPEGITEADLDEMVPEPDPIRTVLRLAIVAILEDRKDDAANLVADALMLHQQGL